MTSTFDCPHFDLLRRRFDELIDKFLAAELVKEVQDPLQFQADADNLAAFRLLMHAEIETFLEERAKQRLSTILSAIDSGHSWERSNPNLFALLALNSVILENHPVQNSTGTSALAARIVAACKQEVGDNNGIKEAAFIRLSIMAGKTSSEIDSSTAALLNSYGKERGQVAHRSTSMVRSLQAPSAEEANARTIVEALQAYFEVQRIEETRLGRRRKVLRSAPTRIAKNPHPAGPAA